AVSDESKRERLQAETHAHSQFRRCKSKHRCKEPDRSKLYIPPDHSRKDKSRRGKCQEWGEQSEPHRSAQRNECKQPEAQPIKKRGEQKHAQRSRCERVDEPPEQPHRRRLPVAEMPGSSLRIDVAGVNGDVPRVEREDGEAKTRQEDQDECAGRGTASFA